MYEKLSTTMHGPRLPQPSLAALCEALQGCATLQILSMNYCNLTCSCGEALGTLLAMTQIRYSDTNEYVNNQ